VVVEEGDVKAEQDDRLPLKAGTPVPNDQGSGLHILVVDHDLETAAAAGRW